MRADRVIAVQSGDFVRSAKGRFARWSVLENQLALSFSIALGSWEGDPLLGHRFEELARAKDSAATRRRVADLAKQAVQWLIDDGSLTRVDVVVERIDRGRLAFEVDALSAEADSPARFGPYFVAIGV